MATNNKLFGNRFDVQALADTIEIRATKGVLYLALDDATVPSKIYVYNKYKEVTEQWDSKNKEYIRSAFLDYGVKKIVVAVGHDDADGIDGSLEETLKLVNKIRFNGWIVAPAITTNDAKKTLCDFVKAQRTEEDYPLKGVVYNYKPDFEGVVNFTGTDLEIDNYTENEYCLDVASVFCTLGANESITNHVVKKVKNCDVKTDADKCVAEGELFLINNGIDIVFTNGVNSLQTIPEKQNEYLTHVRVIESIDLVKEDINTICNKKVLGKRGNSYSNRRTLCADINNYLTSLQGSYLSNDEKSYCELDVEATREYLEKTLMINTDEMEDEEVLKQKLGTYVFLSITLYIMDIMEDITFKIRYEI